MTMPKRVATGALLVLAACAVAFAGAGAVAALFAAAGLAAAFEAARLGLGCGALRAAPPALAAAFALAAWRSPAAREALFVAAAALWLWMVLVAAAFRQELCARRWFRAGLLWTWPLLIAAAWIAALRLHALAPWWLLYALALGAAADIGAYYAGRRFGGALLCPEISPGKTRAGLWGGMLCALAVALAGAPLLARDLLDVAYLTAASLIAALGGVVGDLFASAAKRCGGRKDSGALLPGHGGVLDRIDSHLVAVPVFCFLVLDVRL